MKAIQTLRSRRSLLSFGAASLLAVSAAAQVAGNAPTSAMAPGSTGIDNSGQYQHEVQACREGNTQENLQTCLREARNAQAARKQGTLTLPNQDFQANAQARCDVFKNSEDRAACQARVMGYGSTTGSVAGGGLLRRVETAVVPPGQEEITIQPKTSDPVVLIPGTPDSSSASPTPGSSSRRPAQSQ